MKERITYIDVAKGICMLLIMCAHIGVPIDIPRAHAAQTTTFFMLSGYFFSIKGNFKDFMKKNVNSILIPFVIFYLFSYALFYLGKRFVPGFTSMTAAKGILDCVTQKQYFNGPLWFLLSLFWIRLITYGIIKCSKNEIIQFVLAILCTGGGYLLGHYHIDIPLSFDSALSAVLVFYVGYLLKKYSVLERYNKVESGIFAIIFYISCITIPGAIENSINRFSGSFVAVIYISLVLSVALILFSKCFLSWSKVLSFIGRNTMWLMCTHHLVYRPVKLGFDRLAINGDFNAILTFLITLTLCCLTAPIVEKYLPRLIGKTPINKS